MKNSILQKRFIAALLLFVFMSYNFSLGVLAADIVVGGPLPTDTTITVNGSITNISTGTTVGNGTIGINSFGRFNVGDSDIVNLNLINNQNKLVNLIFQDSASKIDGTVYSYMNGTIGGNILFANPNGFVIGSNGVFNVGSLTLITPKEDTMKDLIDYGVFQSDVYDETKIERLVSFTFNDQDYLVNGNEFNPIELAASPITIDGKINSGGGIDLISGSEVNLQSTSELNANMKFTVENNQLKKVESNPITSATTATYPTNLAMQSGKNIVIVASNKDASSDVLSAIVNLKGTVSANGGDVIARTEVFQTDKEAGDAKSEINVAGTIKGGNILIDAVSKIADFDNNIVGISQSAYDNYFGYIGELLNWVTEDFAHLAKVDTSVNIENNAVIDATNDVVIGALSDMTGISVGILDSMQPNVNVNVTYIDANTNAVVKKGSSITAKNLKVNATTDLSLSTTTKSTNIFDNKLGKDPGSYAVNVTNTDIDNKAIIENGATLEITDDIDVIAQTSSFHSDLTKNGVIPVVEVNKGALGGAISVIIKDVKNEAIMNANAEISGELKVLADYSGNISSSLSAASSGTGTSISGGTGEDSKIDQIFQYFRKLEKIDKVVTRANAKYSNFDSAAAVGIAVDEVVSTAQIGDSAKSIKPEITADKISVQASALDDKSSVYASAESEGAGKTASGAFAVNYKDLDANATAYGDFTLNGSTTSGDTLSINATTTIDQPYAWIDWWSSFTPFFADETWSNAADDFIKSWDAHSTNSASEILEKFASLSEFSKVLDAGTWDILYTIDFNNLGAAGFFSTFANSKANATAKSGNTNAISGAIAMTLYNADAKALLDNNSTVLLKAPDANRNSGINVTATSHNEVLTGATLMDLMNATDFLSGATARDGSAYGGGTAFTFSDSDVIAKIGENVNITKDSGVSLDALGSVVVNAKEDGYYVTISGGSSSPDNAGLAGSIAMTTLGSGTVRASIEDGAKIEAKSVDVTADKDDILVNTVIAFANGQKSYGFGISGMVLSDTVEAYVGGTINANDSINVDATYDKLIVNGNFNTGIAKKGTDDPPGEIDNAAGHLDGYELVETRWYDVINKIKNKYNTIKALTDRTNAGYDFNRVPNPDKKTVANAGGLNVNIIDNIVKAYVKDGATLTAEKDVKVNASVADEVYDLNLVVAANGSSGGGAAIIVDFANNNVESSIGKKAAINAKKAIEVTADDEYKLIDISAGVAHEKDTVGAGNLSSAVQTNQVTAAIKNGAKINDDAESSEQSVKVEGKVDSRVIKAVGAAAIQAGGSGQDAKGAVGATVDGDVVLNTIKAYIDGATVNATKSIDVNAINDDTFLVVDVAGAVSTANTAGAGTVGGYVAVNEIDAYINNSNINTKSFGETTDLSNQEVNVLAKSTFKEVDVVGTVAAGNKTGVGASIRVDAIVNAQNSYINSSTVNANKSATLTNSDTMSQTSVAVAGAGSHAKSAGAGVLSVLVDATTQNNYIDNSKIDVGALSLDTDKKLEAISVTGAIAAALGGVSVGASGYALGASHEINTYIKNSKIESTNDVMLSSDFEEDAYYITLGGAGGEGVSATGVVSVLVNDYAMNTYVLSNSNSTEKKLTSKEGALKIQSKTNIDTVTVDGNIGVSTGSVSAGGIVNTIVYNSKDTAGIDGVTVETNKGVDILAKVDQKNFSNAVGASAGSTSAVEGIVDTIVIDQVINSYIKNASVESKTGDISVKTDNSLILESGLGDVTIALGGASVGGVVQTLVINQDVKSEIIKSTLKAIAGSITNSSSVYTEIIAALLGGGGASNVAINGSVATHVLNMDTNSIIQDSELTASENAKEGIKNSAFSENNVVTAIVNGNGAGTAAVGGTVYTLVDNSTANALINKNNKEVIINGGDYLSNIAQKNSFYEVALVNGSGAGTAAVNGVVSTIVLNSAANSLVDSTTITNVGNIKINSNNESELYAQIGQGTGAGVAAVNGSVNTVVSTKKSKAEIKNSTISSTGNVVLSADATNSIDTTLVGGAGSGTAAVVGAVNTIVSSDEITASISNSDVTTKVANNSTEDTGILINASDNVSVIGRAFIGGGSGTAAVGAAVVTGIIGNQVKALVNDSDLTATNADIILSSVANEVIGGTDNPFLTIGVFGAGVVGVNGSVDTLVLNSSSIAEVSGKKSIGLIAGDKTAVNSEGDTELVLGVGSGGGGGVVGVGATVSTVVVEKDIEAIVNNTTVESANINIDAKAHDVIQSHAVAGSFSKAVATSGVINTTVVNSDMKAGISNSNIYANDITVDSTANAEYFSITGDIAGSAVVGVGASVATNVVGYDSSAYIDNSTVKGKNKTDKATNISVNSNVDTDYSIFAVSGALAGKVSVAGAVQTNVVNNTIKAYVTGDISSEKLNVKAEDIVDFYAFTDSVSGSLRVGVGATILTNSITSTVLSYIGGSNVNVGTIKVDAIGTQNFNDLVAFGFGFGLINGDAGTSLVNLVDATTKAYITKNSKITENEKLTVNANNTTKITELAGSNAASLIVSVAPTVAINRISNTTEAFTQDGVTLNSKEVEITAQTTTKLGEKDNRMQAGAGSEAVIVGAAGSGLENTIKNTTIAYVGKSNKISPDESLNIKAQDDTFVYENIGNLAIGAGGGVGASVGLINIKNTVLAYIGSESVLDMVDGNITLNAISNEIVDAYALVIGGGALGALSGGGLSLNIGEEVDNALLADLSTEDAENFATAKGQADSAYSTSENYKNTPGEDYEKYDFKKYYNQASVDVDSAISDAQTNANINLTDEQKVTVSANNISPKSEDFSLMTKSNEAGSSIMPSTDVNGTTSAYIDSKVVVNAKDITVKAENTDNVKLEIDGHSYGGLAVGVAVAVSNVATTTNSFISNNVTINSTGKIEIEANSTDSQKLTVEAGAGGIVSGSGGKAGIESKKNSNAYILDNSILNAKNSLIIKAIADENIISEVNTIDYGLGLNIGVSDADAILGGGANVNIGEAVTLNSSDEKLSIIANTTEKAQSFANATSGSLNSGTGAEADAKVEKTNSIKIGKKAKLLSKSDTLISSEAKNTAIAETDGRAYGSISAGGTKTRADISYLGCGINIADSDTSNKGSIKAESIKITSTVDNNADASTNAGAGAVVGIGGSGVYTDINSNNSVYVGKNNDVTTTGGSYVVGAEVNNSYNSSNDSSAYGVVGVGVAYIKNNVTSNVSTVSNANVESAGAINLGAINKTIKSASENYDLYGGLGGVVNVGCASLKDVIEMTTAAELGGDYAHASGLFENGFVTASASSVLDVNEKVDVDAGGVIPASNGDVSINSKVTTTTTISNKDISSKDDDIYFLADTDIDIYAKSNVEADGVVGGAGGDSFTKNNETSTSVIIKSGVNSQSGRDTYIQAVCAKDIEAYIYTISHGLLGIATANSTAYNDSATKISIENNANLKSYDSMNLISLDKKGKFTAHKDSKSYILWGIPIHSSGDGDITDISDATITLNGTLESGLGANRKLVINKDGTYISEGVDVKGNVKVGEYTSENIKADIQAYEKSKEGAIKPYDDYIATEKQVINNANNQIKELTDKKGSLEGANKSMSASVDNINNVTTAWNDAYDSNTGTVSNSFENTLSSITDSRLNDVKTAYSNYIAEVSDENLASLKTSVDALTSVSIELTKKIGENTISITDCETAIVAQNSAIATANNSIETAESEKAKISDKYDAIIEGLKSQQTAGKIDVYSFNVDDVYVRSGETNVTGKMTGEGSITTPGNNFSIDITNNSIMDVVYKNLVIDKYATGTINGSDIANTITKNIKNSGNNYKISILNTVDGNDPLIDLNLTAGFGDMVFEGNVENIKGLVSFVNNTGNVLSSGSITAKDLKISIPNGAYEQKYTNSNMLTGGSDGTGAIIAAGDIDISSKVIDVNGLIQSGSEVKSVTIPKFTVVYDDRSGEGKIYQIVDGIRSEMKKGASDGYYYINLDNSDKADEIKAYFKITDDLSKIDNVDISNIKGEIVLFNTEIHGGNITLTGNIISTSNNGKIVLVNGYGHIDVTNNSDFDIVMNTLDASAKIDGKLTINDFKFDSTDQAGTKFDSITQNDITSDWLSANSGTYTASVGADGKIKTTSGGQSSGNGSWGTATSTTRSDGAKISSTTYVPGDDAYYVTKASSVETKSYQEYVKRSWWTELWHGKLYKTVYYNVVTEPEYGVAKNSIAVQFQGFDKPEINVTSNGSIIMDKNISALTGDVNLISNKGSILTNSALNSIIANNITLKANEGNIGEELARFIKISLNGGGLVVNAKDAAINLSGNDNYDLDVTTSGRAYLYTSGNLGCNGKKFKVNADYLQLVAEKGSINIDASSKNSLADITANKVRAEASKDITIVTNNDLTINNVISNKKGTIKLGSRNGSVTAVPTITSEQQTGSVSSSGTIYRHNINGGNVILSAVNGYIGTQENSIIIASDSIINAEAKNDIRLASVGRMYTDLIKSTEGSVNLDADFGVIASESSQKLPYNIYSETGVNLNSKYGNIENIGINTNGVINAVAGYINGVASGMSDVKISLVSQKGLTAEALNSLSSDEARTEAYNTYAQTIKDMKIGTVKASKNVTIYSEKAILNSDSNSIISAEHIKLSAANGDIGSENSAINLDANRKVTASAGNGRSVYLKSDNDLKIGTISTYTGNMENSPYAPAVLENVVLTSTNGSITNATLSQNETNVTANNIILSSGNNIGSSTKYFVVDTKSNDSSKGLNYSVRNNAYIKGVSDDLNLVYSNVGGNSNIMANDTLTIADGSKIKVTGDLTTSSNIVNVIGKLKVGGNAYVIANDTLTIADSSKTNVTGDLTTSSNIANVIGELTVGGNANVTANKELTIADGSNVNVTGDLTTSSNIANIIGELTVGGNANVTANKELTIADSSKANVMGDLTTSSNIANVIGELTVGGNANISANDYIAIKDADITGDLSTNAPVITIDDINLRGNFNANTDNLVLNTSNDLNIGNIIGNAKNYVTNVDITSNGSIYNGLANDGINIQGKNVDVKADNDIGTKNKPLRIKLVGDNRISMKSNNSISVSTTGADANWTNLSTGDLNLSSDNNIYIKNLDVDTVNLNTTASNLTVDSMIVNDSGTMNVGKKAIAIDNNSFAPVIDADLQLKLVKMPTSIKVDGSNNIITDIINVVRKNQNITVNHQNNYGSMNDTLTSSIEASLKNTKVADNTIEKTDSLIYQLPTKKRYKNKYKQQYTQGIIRNQIDEMVTPANAFGVINLSNYFDKKEEAKYNRVSSL